MTINATVCICSYFHMSFCTNSRELLQLSVSLQNRALHKEVQHSTDKHCFGKLPWGTQHSGSALRGHPCQKLGQQIDSRTSHTLYHNDQPDLAWTALFGVVQVRGQDPACPSPSTQRGQRTQLCRPGEEPLSLRRVQCLPSPTTITFI